MAGAACFPPPHWADDHIAPRPAAVQPEEQRPGHWWDLPASNRLLFARRQSGGILSRPRSRMPRSFPGASSWIHGVPRTLPERLACDVCGIRRQPGFEPGPGIRDPRRALLHSGAYRIGSGMGSIDFWIGIVDVLHIRVQLVATRRHVFRHPRGGHARIGLIYTPHMRHPAKKLRGQPALLPSAGTGASKPYMPIARRERSEFKQPPAQNLHSMQIAPCFWHIAQSRLPDIPNSSVSPVPNATK